MAYKSIVFTGGGSAGHVTPNLAIISEIDVEDWDIHYIGSKQGIEKELIEQIRIPYYGISSGKMRRYLDLENIIDLFKVIKGCSEARRILKKIKPDLVFSKGGFVSVPVIVAASSLKIPIYIHESDITPGLANKISQRFASKIFTSFEETKKYFPEKKTKVIGSPIRKEIMSGTASKGHRLLGFDDSRPILTIMGGSLGAKKINETVRKSMKQLCIKYQIVHICGKNHIDPHLLGVSDYQQFEYVHEELADILAATNLVVTRGGSNSIFEFKALKIPMLIIPLPLHQSRGDQILNANSFENKGYSVTLEEEGLTPDSLVEYLEIVQRQSEDIRRNMESSLNRDALSLLKSEIKNVLIKS